MCNAIGRTMNNKLKLSKETLKTLSPKLLKQVIGGTDLDDSDGRPAGGTDLDTLFDGPSLGCNGV